MGLIVGAGIGAKAGGRTGTISSVESQIGTWRQLPQASHSCCQMQPACMSSANRIMTNTVAVNRIFIDPPLIFKIFTWAVAHARSLVPDNLRCSPAALVPRQHSFGQCGPCKVRTARSFLFRGA